MFKLKVRREPSVRPDGDPLEISGNPGQEKTGRLVPMTASQA